MSARHAARPPCHPERSGEGTAKAAQSNGSLKIIPSLSFRPREGATRLTKWRNLARGAYRETSAFSFHAFTLFKGEGGPHIQGSQKVSKNFLERGAAGANGQNGKRSAPSAMAPWARRGRDDKGGAPSLAQSECRRGRLFAAVHNFTFYILHSTFTIYPPFPFKHIKTLPHSLDFCAVFC